MDLRKCSPSTLSLNVFTNGDKLTYPFVESDADYLKFHRNQLYCQNSKLAVLVADPNFSVKVSLNKSQMVNKDDSHKVSKVATTSDRIKTHGVCKAGESSKMCPSTLDKKRISADDKICTNKPIHLDLVGAPLVSRDRFPHDTCHASESDFANVTPSVIYDAPLSCKRHPATHKSLARTSERDSTCHRDTSGPSRPVCGVQKSLNSSPHQIPASENLKVVAQESENASVKDKTSGKNGESIHVKLVVSETFSIPPKDECKVQLDPADMSDIGKHLLEISKDDRYLEIDVDTICYILSCDNLNVRNELMVFRAAVRWLKYDYECRKVHAPRALSCVRYGLIKPRDLIKCYVKASEAGFLDIPEFCENMFAGVLWSTAYHFDVEHLIPDLQPTPRKKPGDRKENLSNPSSLSANVISSRLEEDEQREISPSMVRNLQHLLKKHFDK